MDSQGIEPRTFRMQSEHYTPKPQAHVIVMVAETMIHKQSTLTVPSLMMEIVILTIVRCLRRKLELSCPSPYYFHPAQALKPRFIRILVELCCSCDHIYRIRLVQEPLARVLIDLCRGRKLVMGGGMLLGTVD